MGTGQGRGVAWRGVPAHGPRPSPQIRLTGGRTAFEGRVEVKRGSKWGTVCSDGWTTKEAMVACRQLGLGYSLHAMTVGAGGEAAGDTMEHRHRLAVGLYGHNGMRLLRATGCATCGQPGCAGRAVPWQGDGCGLVAWELGHPRQLALPPSPSRPLPRRHGTGTPAM